MKKLLTLLLCAFSLTASAQYTTTYNSTSYTSPKPYNLDIYYFKAADVPLDPTYRKRVSAMFLWLQNFYKQQMVANGYGTKTFGLWTAQGQPDSVRIVLVNGAHNLDYYRSTTPGGNDSLISEMDAFRAANPALVTSEHRIILTATPSFAAMTDLPYYGIGRSCYATDYPQLDTQYIGQTDTNGTRFVTYFGGIAHELGHGLNLPHSHQTATENAAPAQGESLMAAGNYTLTAQPTFINRAGSAILANCQLFSPVVNTGFYNGHLAGLTALHSVVRGDTLIVSGRFQSNRTVTDINFYQDPGATPTAGYSRVAFSTPPVGVAGDSFWVAMPATEVLQGASTYPPTGPYNLEIELVLANGETSEEIFPFSYANSIPVGPAGFDDNVCDPTSAGWTLTDIGATPPFPGQACWTAATQSLRLKSWGTGLADNADAATFFYVPLLGDDTLVARVTATPSDWNSLAGLMLRTDLTPGSPFTTISSLDTRGVFDYWRTGAGGNTSYNLVTTFALPMWLRLARTGNMVNTWYSADGLSWTAYAIHAQPMGATAYVGLVASGPGAQGVFDNIRLGGRALGINDLEIPAQLSVSPNPAADVLSVLFEGKTTGKAEISLTDVQGKTVRRETLAQQPGSNEVKLDVRHLAAGLYLLRVQGGREAAQVVKVIVAR